MKYRDNLVSELAIYHFLGAIDSMIAQGRFRKYPQNTTTLLGEDRSRIMRLKPINRAQTIRFRIAALLMAHQIIRFFGPELLYEITRYLQSMEWIVLADSAGKLGKPVLGFVKRRLPDFNFMGFALGISGRTITKFELAATLFHELVHVADPENRKLDLYEYELEYQKLATAGTLDSFGWMALKDRKELISLTFQGCLFGSPGPLKSHRQLEARVNDWRELHATHVLLANRDYERLFSDVSFEVEGNLVMTPEPQIVRPVRRRDEGIIMCGEFPEEPILYDPVYRGTLEWLREQARQAELNPNREWDGFQAEWDQLIAGTHPDPHPELIILGQVREDFDPTQLEEPKEEMWFTDTDALSEMRMSAQFPRFDYPYPSQQLFASLCGSKMDGFLEHSVTTMTA